MKRLLLSGLLLISLFRLNAQNQPTGNLTVFSEDGDKFFLLLNGEKQNSNAQSNIRIEELPQPYYNVKIIFSDSSIGLIAKANLPVAGQDGTMMDVTYKVRKDKSGKPHLNYYSATAPQPNYVPSEGMFVHHFGQQDPVNNAVVSTSTTVITTANPQTASMTLNGAGVNVTINQPMVTESTMVTTTSTTSSSNVSGPVNNANTTGSMSTGCNGYAMEGSDFSAAKKTVSDASFEDTRLSTAKSIASSNCLCVNQVAEICKLFGYEDSKLAFAKFAYKYVTDPKNYFKLGSVFTFDSNKEALNHFLAGN